MNAFCKLILVALFVILNGSATLQSPVAQNYSTDLLRLAKAAQIKAYLDEDKEPCGNFYKFACGKWQRLHPARANDKKTAYLEQLQDLYLRKSAEMLKASRRIEINEDVMLKDFYESCRNKDALQQLGMNPIIKFVNFRGGWPKITSQSWYEYEFDWLKVIADLRQSLGVDIFVGLDVIADFEDKDMHRIKIGAPQLALGTKDAYLSEDHESERDDYRERIANKLHQHFPDMHDSWAHELAAQVVDVEQELAKGLPDNSRLSDKQTSRLRYASELKSAYGNYVDLSRYLNIVFNQTIYVQVYESPEDYLANLVEVIKRTPKLVIANYTMWRVLEQLDFAGEINWKQNDNWCVQKVKKYFPHELESMFHRNYNNIHLRNDLQSVWADIKKAFREELQTNPKLNWISSDTRQKALLKLDAMELEVVAAHGEENPKPHAPGFISRNKYYENLINILHWKTQRKLAKLIEKPQFDDVEITLPKYQLAANKIQIPTTFLQARFFWDATYPTSLKYSTIGFVLAQAMLQGFDSVGRKYDQHGHQRSWWDHSSEYGFDERADCFAKQYANYEFQDKKVDDPNALITSVADNGALAIAYRAYDKWWTNVADNEHTDKETLPLLNYKQNQLFFIGFAQLWCADYHESFDNFTELPERLRVIGALANLNEFSSEFQCKRGAKMNPAKKCAIY